MQRHASCSCGALTVTTDGEPIRFSMCHCLACQRRTGSVFGVQARFPNHAITIAGRSTAWRRVGDEGSTITFHFCPTCGATVYYTDELGAFTAIPIGAFADPNIGTPTVSVYEARKHPWVSLPNGIEHYD
jgi:hypothetical protein